MQVNRTKAKLRSGQTVFGCFVRYPHPDLVELLGYQGWDFLIFDGEHGTVDPASCENMVRAAELRAVTPLVRVAVNHPSAISRFLDTGALGVHVPWISSAADADAAVRAVKYHPRGHRGLAGVRAADYGQREPLSEYVQKANAETMVVVQVESREALTKLEEIAEVDGVDVLFVGPTDLAHSLGLSGQSEHREFAAVLDRIVKVATRSRAALGIWVSDAQAARTWRDRGARYITTNVETLLVGGRDFLERVRSAT